jgi:mannose-6-phosphate isomerase
MSITQLRPRLVEKIWGRRDLPAPFGPIASDGPPVGEIWFEDPAEQADALLIKYLFTSDKLSVQVHPDDSAAKRQGHPGGKEEAWWVLAADEGATIGLGLRERLSPGALRAAALDGSVEDLLDWRPARPGDSYYLPAGTIHAIGAGLALVEVQQNADLTYRLFDYGRDRELHLDQAVAVATPGPHSRAAAPFEFEPGRTILADGRAFVLERWTGPRSGRIRTGDRSAWLMPLGDAGALGGRPLEAGSVWRVEGEAELSLTEGAAALVA